MSILININEKEIFDCIKSHFRNFTYNINKKIENKKILTTAEIESNYRYCV